MSQTEWPLVSIVIPAFNAAQWLRDALNSVLEQTYSHWECIVIDDGSLDSTRQVMDSYKVTDERIRYIYKENGGPSSARNVGIQSSNGELVAFLDADDVWLPAKLMKQVDVLFAAPEAGLCCTYFEEVDEDLNLLNPWRKVKERNRYPDDIRPELLVENVNCCGVPGSASSAVVRRECFEKLGLFDTRLRVGEDLDMWYRIALNYPIIQRKEVLVRLRIYPKKTDISRLISDLTLFVEKARKIAPESHLAIIEKADYDRCWGAFALCCRECRFLFATRLFTRLFFHDPLETVLRIGAGFRTLLDHASSLISKHRIGRKDGK